MPVFMGLIKTNQTEAFNNLTFKYRILTILKLRTVKSKNKGIVDDSETVLRHK